MVSPAGQAVIGTMVIFLGVLIAFFSLVFFTFIVCSLSGCYVPIDAPRNAFISGVLSGALGVGGLWIVMDARKRT